MPDIHPHTDLPDLAYPYALDALTAAERRAVEHMLDRADEATAAAFRATVYDLRETLAAMTVVDAVPAPPSVEQALLRALDAQLGEESKHRPAGRRWLALAAAVAVAIGIGAGITVYRSQSPDIGPVTAQQVATHGDAREQTVPVTGGGTITVTASRELGAAIVSFAGVAAPPPQHTYQVWLVGDTGAADSVGVLDALPTSRAPMLMRFGDAGQLAVSVEPAGGSLAPTTRPVVDVPLR
ncbi:anti-sigma factor domain-containing protein [Nocardia sp. XZ_19_385]|uniref:anti-sigma factor n=1 Tax=Nocardia sp. XZ_19_385 TaxID=2769488 RepID=UPI00188E3549|nr:anti-sigma factor [Nocardia sp. XZ_19_385]